MTPTPPSLAKEQKNRLAQRLSVVNHDYADVGQGLPRTVRAPALGQGSGGGAARLKALVDALVFERMIVPIDVGPDPHVTGVHAGEDRHNPTDFVRAQTPAGEALAIHSPTQALSAHRPDDRPTALGFRTIGLTALVETGGHVVVNPDTDTVLLPCPAMAAFAQGDEWLPAWRDEALREFLLVEAIIAYPAIVDVETAYAGDGLTRVIVSMDRASFVQGAGASAIKETLSTALNALGTNPRLITSAGRVEVTPVLRQTDIERSQWDTGRAMIADLATSLHFWYSRYDRLGESPGRKRKDPTWIPTSRQKGCHPSGAPRRGSGTTVDIRVC